MGIKQQLKLNTWTTYWIDQSHKTHLTSYQLKLTHQLWASKTRNQESN